MNLIELDDLRTKPPHLLRPRARNALEQREAREGYSTEEGLLASLSKAVSRERLPSKAARRIEICFTKRSKGNSFHFPRRSQTATF